MEKMKIKKWQLIITALICGMVSATCKQAFASDWPMAGANPQRTSWVKDAVPGELKVTWFRPIEPYIAQKCQIIAVDGTLFVSTASGLYTFDAKTGKDGWVYPTVLPIENSPTVIDGVAYIGCYDKYVHAINVKTGKRLWISQPAAKAGFSTNPLVITVGGKKMVIAGCRDGYLYCFDAASGKQLWKFNTDGPILYSAAYKDGVVYFASNDSYAYAVDAKTGKKVWKSAKLPSGISFLVAGNSHQT